jgi:ribosomal protein L11 methyltransferase
LYYRLVIRSDDGPTENIANLAFENDALGLEEKNGQLEIYFKDEQQSDSFEKVLVRYAEEYSALNKRELKFSTLKEGLPEVNWNSSWQKSWKPTRVGNFVVHPPWERPAAEQGVTALEIKPGMAFGTGTHPTTHLLLKWIDRADFSEQNVLDVGSGSGILAIAAIKRGAPFALGIDIDADAVDNARENATLNDVAHETFFRLMGPGQLEQMYRFQVVMANMIYPKIADLFDDLVRLTEPGGELLISGLLDSDQPKISELASEFPLTLQETKMEGEWLAIRYQRQE